MDYIIFDLEATCWDVDNISTKKEIIEIGAVRLTERLNVNGEFQSFVRPLHNPELSDFCKELTSITQEDIAKADLFPKIFKDFTTWMDPLPYRFCSWGIYDLTQLMMDCARHGIIFPGYLVGKHINLKNLFAKVMDTKRYGLEKALKKLEIPLEGTHHRAIDDARNITKIAQMIFKQATEVVHLNEFFKKEI